MKSFSKKAVWLIVAALMIVMAPVWALTSFKPNQAKVDPYLEAQMASGAPLRVFVHGSTLAAARNASVLAGLRIEDSFDRVNVVVASGSPRQILAVGREPGINYLEGDRPIRFHMNTSHTATRADEVQAGFTEGSSTTPPLDGSGVSIAIIDEGIDGTHPMFQVNGQSKVVRNLKNVPCALLTACTGPDGDSNENLFIDVTDSTNDSDTISAGGHGTHVAGTAAGVAVTTSTGQQLVGAAPGAKLVGLSVGAGLSVYGGAAGMNWVLEHHEAPCGTPSESCPPIKVINNSWGGSGEFNSDSAVSKIQDLLVSDGVTVVWAAGNGDTTNNGGDGSDNRVGDDAQSPTPGVIAVANYDDDNSGTRNGSLNSSSSRGHSTRPVTWPDVSAPGTDITSACRPYLAICNDIIADDPDYGTISGTSMAAPHVAGYVALLLQESPTLTPGQIEDLLEDTAFKFTFGAAYAPDPRNADNTSSFDKGHGLVDIKAAVAKLRDIALTPETPEPQDGFECLTGGPVVEDEQGDTYVVKFIPTNTDVPPYETSLDIREARLGWSAGTLTTSIKVQDLAPGTSAPDTSYTAYFTHGDNGYYVDATTGTNGDSFTFGDAVVVDADAASATNRVIRKQITGSFDTATDTINIVLTNADLASLGEAQLSDGEILTGLTFASRRPIRTPVSVLGTSADTTTETCQFKLGTGPISPPPPPPPPPPPGPDGSMDVTNTVHSWTGEAGPDAIIFVDDNPSGCSGGYNDTDCDIERINITVPAPGRTLRVDITSLPNQYWLWVYAPDGTLFGDSSFILAEQFVEGFATQSGVYQVVLQSIATVAGEYEGKAELLPVPPPPPPGGSFDGEVDTTNTLFTWRTGPVTSANVLFGCGEAPDYEGCEVKKVKVTVGPSGSRLVVKLEADIPDLDDFDLYVYAPDGTLVDDSATGGGSETVTKDITVSGIYTIVVNAFSTVEASYDGSVELR